MNKKGIWLLNDIKPEHLERLKELAPDHELVNRDDDFPIENIEIVYGWDKIKAEEAGLLETEGQLKWIQVASAGVDYMDLDTLNERSILLTNASGIHSVPIDRKSVV